MKFLSVRDLRKKSAEIWRELPREGEMVVTSNGHPVAMLTPINQDNLEGTLNDWRQMRATRAIAEMQKGSLNAGIDGISMDEIEEEIRGVRKMRCDRST